mgnify:CR=1 FL=1
MLQIITIVGTEEDVPMGAITVIIDITNIAHALVGKDIDCPVPRDVLKLTNVQTDLMDVTRSVLIQHQTTDVPVTADITCRTDIVTLVVTQMNVTDQTCAILILLVVILLVPTHALATQVMSVLGHIVIIKMSALKEVTIALRVLLVPTEPLTSMMVKNSYALAAQVIPAMVIIVIIKTSAVKGVTIAMWMPLVLTEPLTSMVVKNSHAPVWMDTMIPTETQRSVRKVYTILKY